MELQPPWDQSYSKQKQYKRNIISISIYVVNLYHSNGVISGWILIDIIIIIWLDTNGSKYSLNSNCHMC